MVSMKAFDRFCAVVLVILVVILIAGCGAWFHERGQTAAEIEAEFMSGFPGYELYDSAELTGDMLKNRSAPIIERVVGVVEEASTGDGRVLNAADPDYAYISYRNSGLRLKNGDRVLTYLVYEPGTGVDNISERFDYIINGGK